MLNGRSTSEPAVAADAHGGAHDHPTRPSHLRPEVLETAAHHGTLELLGEGGGALTESVVVEQREQQLLLRGGGPCPWHEQISVLANFG